MKINELFDKDITIASVESFTGGLFASEIVKIPGASKYFKGALVTYSNEIKEKLGVDTSKGVINKEVAHQMASKGKKYFNVSIGCTGGKHRSVTVVENLAAALSDGSCNIRIKHRDIDK